MLPVILALGAHARTVCVCVCVHTYKCIYTYTHTYIYIIIHTHTHAHTHRHTQWYMSAQRGGYNRVCECVCMWGGESQMYLLQSTLLRKQTQWCFRHLALRDTYIYIYTYTHTHTYIYIYICAKIHTQKWTAPVAEHVVAKADAIVLQTLHLATTAAPQPLLHLFRIYM